MRSSSFYALSPSAKPLGAHAAPRAGHGRRAIAAFIVGMALLVLAGISSLAARGVGVGAAGTPRAGVIELHPDGDFAHPVTGFPMPKQVGPFERVQVTQYDDAGLNLSAGYNAVLGRPFVRPVLVTLYVYPAESHETLDARFDALQQDIGRHHGGVRPELQKAVTLAGEHPARYAIFGYNEPWAGSILSIPLRSYLLLYRDGDFWVKWRATTPAPIDETRMKAIVELTETLVPVSGGGG